MANWIALFRCRIVWLSIFCLSCEGRDNLDDYLKFLGEAFTKCSFVIHILSTIGIGYANVTNNFKRMNNRQLTKDDLLRIF